jgi:dihydroxycyclohexadiene carboxylate dehydrogenase
MYAGRFTGKSIVVTGAAQGIGQAVAVRAAAEGGQVLFVDRAEFIEDIARQAAGDTAAHRCDLESYDGAQSAITRAEELFGRVDILINNVGGAIWMKPFGEFTPEEIEAEIRRSLLPTLWCCHAALPALRRAGGGTIVNLSSVATSGVNRMPYSAAKGGVNALTRSLAMECAPYNIRVVAAAPGGTDAPPRRIPRNASEPGEQERQWMDEVVEQTKQSSLMGRYGSLEEQAAAVLFLASDEASYITGTVLPVSGGDLG